MSDRDLLAQIHDKAANYLVAQKFPLPDSIHVQGLFGGMEEIWNMTRDAWEAETGKKAEHP